MRRPHPIQLPRQPKWRRRTICDRPYDTARTTDRRVLVVDPVWQACPLPDELRELILTWGTGFQAWAVRRVDESRPNGLLVATGANTNPIPDDRRFTIGGVEVTAHVRYLCATRDRVVDESRIYWDPVPAAAEQSLLHRAFAALAELMDAPPLPEPAPPLDEEDAAYLAALGPRA